MGSDESVREGASAGPAGGGTLRVFCAVELPFEIRAAAAAQAARLRRDFPEARASWARPESLHITLKFVGEIEAARVGDLSRAAGAAAGGAEPFRLTIEESGTFPPRGAARVLWLGVKDAAGQLARLQRRLEQECEAAGFPGEARAFKPHLTLARIRAPQGAHALSESHRRTPFGPQHFDVTELLVIRSELGPGGSRYTPLSRHPFEGGSPG